MPRVAVAGSSDDVHHILGTMLSICCLAFSGEALVALQFLQVYVRCDSSLFWHFSCHMPNQMPLRRRECD